jgi:hypothetical protein
VIVEALAAGIMRAIVSASFVEARISGAWGLKFTFVIVQLFMWSPFGSRCRRTVVRDGIGDTLPTRDGLHSPAAGPA